MRAGLALDPIAAWADMRPRRRLLLFGLVLLRLVLHGLGGLGAPCLPHAGTAGGASRRWHGFSCPARLPERFGSAMLAVALCAACF